MLGECHISFFILSSLYFYLTLSILGRYSDLWVSANLHISFYPPYIKVTTPKQETAGIANIQTQGTAAQEVYTIDGVKVGNTLKGQKQGLYIVKQGNSIKKVIK